MVNDEDNSENDEERLYRVDTVPPPEGESDAYNAPTKVGPMAASAIAEMMKAAGLDRAVADFNDRVKDKSPDSRPTPNATAAAAATAGDASTPASGRPGLAALPPPPPAPSSGALTPPNHVPRVYEDAEEDEENAATLLSLRAKQPSVGSSAIGPSGPLVMPPQRPLPQFPQFPPPSAFGPVEAPEPARPWIRRQDLLLVAIVLAACGIALYLLRC